MPGKVGWVEGQNPTSSRGLSIPQPNLQKIAKVLYVRDTVHLFQRLTLKDLKSHQPLNEEGKSGKDRLTSSFWCCL
ncbi:MAG: hypothetical protein RLZZ338_3028 [Cyanobacteriota bacterium]|jgi:hypothetical protein